MVTSAERNIGGARRMRMHIVSVPQTSTYRQEAVKSCTMMNVPGHAVYLYAGEEGETAATS